MSKIGVMVCGHGSRDADAVREFEAVAEGIAARLPQYTVASGFLEFARPIIRDGLDRLRAQGVREVLAVPGMLFAAGHAKNDIPSVLNTYQESVRSGGEMAGGRAVPGFTMSSMATAVTGLTISPAASRSARPFFKGKASIACVTAYSAQVPDPSGVA